MQKDTTIKEAMEKGLIPSFTLYNPCGEACIYCANYPTCNNPEKLSF